MNINGSTYNQKKFDKFLRSEKSDYISHSINKIQKSYIFNSTNKINIIDKIKKLFLYFFDTFQLDKSIKKKNIDILIISNLLSSKSISSDLYFGQLDKILLKQQIKTKKIYRNLLDINHNNLSNDYKSSKFILGKRLPIIEEFFHFLLTLKEIFIFFFSYKYKNIKKDLNILDFFSIVRNLSHVKQIFKCVKKLNPKMVIFTFEGHAWERMLNYSIKQNNKNIITVGYQFSIIKRGQLGFFMNLKKNYNPDYLAASGELTYQMLKKKIKHVEIFKLGSNKWRKKRVSSKEIILIALDDNEFLEYKMLDFCNKIKNIKIIIRLHPLISNNPNRVNNIKKKISKNKNILISFKKLDKDLEKSKYILFTNSSIAYEALFFDVIPLFFKNRIKPNIFDKNFPKEFVVNNKIKFLNIINKNKKFKKINYFKKYQDEYFEKYEIKKIKNLLNK